MYYGQIPWEEIKLFVVVASLHSVFTIHGIVSVNQKE